MWPEQPALLGAHRTWTWAELDAEVDRAAAVLSEAGVGPGDALGVMMSKRPEVVVAFFACARIGAIHVPVNFKLHPEQVADQFRTAGVRAVVVDHELEGLLKHLLPLLPDPRRIFYVDGPGRHGEGVWDATSPGWTGHHVAKATDVVYYNYTSGSTGRPKGALTTHRQINANAVATADGLGFQTNDVYLGMFSVFAHPHELFHRSVLVGGAFVVAETLNPRVAAELIARYRISWTMGVPSFYEMLLDFRDAHGGDYSSLRVLEAGGAYVSSETLERMESAFGARFLPVWGSTETTGVGLGMLADGPRRPGSTGKPIPGYKIRVVREDGSEALAGEVGELWVRGPAVVEGYVNQPEETAQQFQGGWYQTRDLVRVDADGFVFFTGRHSEMLKIGGIRVFPLEIEQVIAQHPDVRNVVVVRAEERLRGEIARAIVQTVPESKLDIRKLQAYCRDRMANYKVPRIVEFWADIPKLPNGKIDKKAVVATAENPSRDDRRDPGEGSAAPGGAQGDRG
ncbi:long-chain-fatty-acid--CoA ligase [Deltaproteobacteria bacterium]|nr:long-chain-fatty-acid--CoA ligase [Deltaproteobacteria bacterium]